MGSDLQHRDPSRSTDERASAAAPTTRGLRARPTRGPRPTPCPPTARDAVPAPRPEPGADPARTTDEPDAGALEVAEELAALGEAVPPPVVDPGRASGAGLGGGVALPVPDLPLPTPAAPPPDAEPLLDTPLPVRTRPLLR